MPLEIGGGRPGTGGRAAQASLEGGTLASPLVDTALYAR